jgi:hypothetical protein
LGFEIGQVIWRFGTTVNSFKFGAFGFFKQDFWCNERFAWSGRESHCFKRSMLIKNFSEGGIELLEIGF